MTDFTSLSLADPILRSIEQAGYETPTPIQAGAIPPLLKGNNLLGVAQTGTGKTAAFTLPLLHRVAELSGKSRPGKPHALILAPTRELAGQIGESLKLYGNQVPLRTCVVYGGSSIRVQIRQLKRGVHILVATPGRLMDLQRQGHVNLKELDIFILDEADRMLDMGFVGDVKKIASELPENAQRVMFSATMPQAVQGLADQLLEDPVKVEVAREATTHENIEQRLLFVAQDKKRALLSHLLDDNSVHRVLIFTRTKRGADRVTKHLSQNGVKAEAFHGDKNQRQRQRVLKAFKQGRTRALVATDVAARGIDVDGVTHVINYEMPTEPDSYVHRIGRTGRGGANGISITFCDKTERGGLYAIEKTIRQSIPIFIDHPFHCEETANAKSGGKSKPKRKSRKSRSKRGKPQARFNGRDAQGKRRFEGLKADGSKSERSRSETSKSKNAKNEDRRPKAHRSESARNDNREQQREGGFKGKPRSDRSTAENRRKEGRSLETRRSEGGFEGKRNSKKKRPQTKRQKNTQQQENRSQNNQSAGKNKPKGKNSHSNRANTDGRNTAHKKGGNKGRRNNSGRHNGGNKGNRPRRRAA